MISFIVPVYNGENYLRPCLDSILSQSVRDIEVICVNDGSTDASQKILKEYAAADARVQVVQQANGGVSAARNHGMELAKGEYIWFFDCDDVLHPRRAARGVQRLHCGTAAAGLCGCAGSCRHYGAGAEV